MTQEEKAKAYDEAKARMSRAFNSNRCTIGFMNEIFPELAESEDEKIRKSIIAIINNYVDNSNTFKPKMIAWLENQSESDEIKAKEFLINNCSEEYCKAYYDGWNNCNMQHSQCKSESNVVVKCLINGMKFYYEDNEEAMWGTDKFQMKVKDILSWLEKQVEKPQGKTALEAWRDMRLEVYQQASGNRHEPNYSDDTTKMFSLNDIDEIIEKISEQKSADKVEPKFQRQNQNNEE